MEGRRRGPGVSGPHVAGPHVAGPHVAVPRWFIEGAGNGIEQDHGTITNEGTTIIMNEGMIV